MHLDGRPIGRFAQPHVQVLALARLEEQHIVAVVELGKLIKLVELRLGVQLGFFATVGEQRIQVVEQMPVPCQKNG